MRRTLRLSWHDRESGGFAADSPLGLVEIWPVQIDEGAGWFTMFEWSAAGQTGRCSTDRGARSAVRLAVVNAMETAAAR